MNNINEYNHNNNKTIRFELKCNSMIEQNKKRHDSRYSRGAGEKKWNFDFGQSTHEPQRSFNTSVYFYEILVAIIKHLFTFHAFKCFWVVLIWSCEPSFEYKYALILIFISEKLVKTWTETFKCIHFKWNQVRGKNNNQIRLFFVRCFFNGLFMRYTFDVIESCSRRKQLCEWKRNINRRFLFHILIFDLLVQAWQLEIYTANQLQDHKIIINASICVKKCLLST